MIRDPKTRMQIKSTYGSEMTEGLLEILRVGYDVNVIGFCIGNRRELNSQMFQSLDYNRLDSARKFMTKNGYFGLEHAGYTKYFLINDKSLNKEAEFVEPQRKDDGSVNKRRLHTAFKKFSKGRKVNKMMLNEFVALVA